MGSHAHVVRQIVLDDIVVDITDRDIQIVQMMAEGKPNKQIASELGMEEFTLRNFHIRGLHRKMATFDRAHLVAVFMRKSLIK